MHLNFKSFLEKIENYILPCQCAICRQVGSVLCPACRAKFPRLIPRCPGCGQKNILGLFCSNCQLNAKQYYFDGLISLSTYEKSGLKTALQSLKYQGSSSIGIKLGKMLGRLLSRQWRKAPIAFQEVAPIMIPLPLHPRRERERGYNQAWLIAQGVAAITGWPINSGLRRLSYQSPSAYLSYSQRQKQIKYFVYQANDLMGKTVILIDDVITTGATVQAASYALKQAGAVKIIVAVIAESG